MVLRGASRNRRPLLAAALAAAFLPRAAAAAETDQFLTWGIELEDSAEPLNDYLQEKFEETLTRVNRKEVEPPCEEIPGRLYRHVFATLPDSRLRRHMQRSSEFDLHPPPKTGFWRYR